jgi:N-acetylmuramoyl-L-alanine amidase
MKRVANILLILSIVTPLMVPSLLLRASASTANLETALICLDPGHGGADPGAVNAAFGLYESEINLDVAYALKALLEGEGVAVIMTRTDDSYRTNADRYNFCNDHQATLLVSIHTNSTTTASMDGTLGLYFHSDDRELAQAIYDVMWPALSANAPDPENFTGFGLNRFASGVLLKSDMPAAMMEPLFMSHEGEASLLVQPIDEGCANLSCRRGEIALALYEGVLNYYAGSTPPPTPTPTPEPGGSLHVAAIEMWSSKKGSNYLVNTEVTIHDGGGAPVVGATVSLATTQPDGTLVRETGTTGEAGTASFLFRTRQTGEFLSTIWDVGKLGWAYDASANVETAESITVP